jgi:hypothetical protein
MDFIRQELNQLMGKDRNKPLFIRISRRDHFDDPDVSSPAVTLFSDLQVQLTRFLPQRPLSKHEGGHRSLREAPRRLPQAAVRDGPRPHEVRTPLPGRTHRSIGVDDRFGRYEDQALAR